MSDKTETINIGGKEYATVPARVVKFHEHNEKCQVETSVEFKEGFALFSAKVTTTKGTFTGHSMGKTGGQKAFEKLESVSVGRALAYAGYLASGAIATYEEMVDVVTATQLNNVKLKYAEVFKAAMQGLDRPKKVAMFCDWCRETLDEQFDFTDPGAWTPDSMKACQLVLCGPDSSVPFEDTTSKEGE